MKKVLSGVFNLAIIFMIVWAIVSFIDIVGQNSMPNPQYMQHNLFTLIF